FHLYLHSVGERMRRSGPRGVRRGVTPKTWRDLLLRMRKTPMNKPHHDISPLVPTANPKRLTATANRLILAPDERSLQVDLVRLDRTGQVAGCVGSRDPGPSTPTQRAGAQIPEAIGVRQY